MESKTTLMVNDIVIPLDDFAQIFLGNMLRGMTLSLGSSGKNIGFNIDANEMTMYSDDTNLQIKDERKRLMIVSTVRGMLSTVEGVVWMDKISLTTRE